MAKYSDMKQRAKSMQDGCGAAGGGGQHGWPGVGLGHDGAAVSVEVSVGTAHQHFPGPLRKSGGVDHTVDQSNAPDSNVSCIRTRSRKIIKKGNRINFLLTVLQQSRGGMQLSKWMVSLGTRALTPGCPRWGPGRPSTAG